MVKKIIIALVVIAVITGVVLMVRNGGGKASSDAGNEAAQETEVELADGETTVVSGSVKELRRLGKNYECAFEGSTEIGALSGNVFVGGDRVRGTYFITDGAGAKTRTEILVSGGYNYIWGTSPLGEIAVRTKTLDDERDGVSDEDLTDERFDFTCKNWKVNNGTFNVPQNIEFSDLFVPTVPVEIPADIEIPAEAEAALEAAGIDVEAALEASAEAQAQ